MDKRQIQSFIELYKKHYGICLTDEEAEQLGGCLLGLAKLILINPEWEQLHVNNKKI